MKRELRDVLRQMNELERAIASRKLSRCAGREIAELTSLLERLEDDKREAEQAGDDFRPHCCVSSNPRWRASASA